MDQLTDKHFGILIAYVIPGFVGLHALGAIIPILNHWLATPPAEPTLSGFLFVLMASTGTGLVISAMRWVIVDQVHHATGLKQPRWDFSVLTKHLSAFDALVIAHYRYYQFYANLSVVFPFWILLRYPNPPDQLSNLVALSFAAGVEIVLFVASRDSLAKYYRRAESLLQTRTLIHTSCKLC